MGTVGGGYDSGQELRYSVSVDGNLGGIALEVWGGGGSGSSSGSSWSASSSGGSAAKVSFVRDFLPDEKSFDTLSPGDWYWDSKDNSFKVKGGQYSEWTLEVDLQQRKRPVIKPEKPVVIKRLEAGERWLDI